MVSLSLSDEQVIELALRLPPPRRSELASMLAESETSPLLVDEGGVQVIHAERTGDIEAAVEHEREQRVQELIAGLTR